MHKYDILENILIEKLIFGWSGLATAPNGQKIIVAGGAIPESYVDLRITKVHKNRIDAQVVRTVKKSPYEKEIPEGWQLYGGCKWLPIPYEKQLEIKQTQIHEAFHPLKDAIGSTMFHPIIPSPESEHYRNKVEFSWGKYISDREGIHDEYRFGFHAPAQFDRIIDSTYCVLADDEVNAIFRDIDNFARAYHLPTYDPKTAQGFWRHLVIRKAKKTGETMILWSLNTDFPGYTAKEQTDLRFFNETLVTRHPNIVSIHILANTGRADIVTGETECIFWKNTISEELLGFHFEIAPKSFFQVNTLGAEKLYTCAIDSIKHRWGILLDLYAGTGTIGIILSEYFEKVYSVEVVESATEDGKRNAIKNHRENVEFINQKVEDFVKTFDRAGSKVTIVLDPPRDWLHPNAIEPIAAFQADEIIYVSCNPATLARDLGGFIEKGYRLTDVTPMDMFPHTHHIETVVRMEKI